MLKEVSAQRDKTIGQLIHESLGFYGIRSRDAARGLVKRARLQSKLTDGQPAVVAQRANAGGQLLWELLAARDDLMLVTGDQALLRDAGMRGRVISAQAFVDG